MKCANKCEGNMNAHKTFVRGKDGGKMSVCITYTCMICYRMLQWVKNEPGMSVLQRGLPQPLEK